MGEYEHIYIKYGNTIYNDFKLYSDKAVNSYGAGSILFGINTALQEYLLSSESSYIDYTIKPNKGAEIWIAPNCPIAIDDIRNNTKK